MRHELKKLLTRGMGLLILLCLLINGYLYYNQQHVKYDSLIQDYPYYLELLSELQQNPEMPLDQLPQTEHSMAIYTIRQQQKHLQIYPDFIRSMPERAQAASRLSSSRQRAFSQRNIEKTVRDFAGMETLPVRADRDLAVVGVYRFVFSDVLVLAFVLIVCVKLFSREYEGKLYPLVLATPSRLKVALHKIGALFLLTVLVTAAVYGANLLIGGVVFGLGDLSRPIQSIAEFRTCSMRISCGDYLWIGYLIKLSSAFVFGLLALMTFTLLKKAVAVFFAIACFLGISFGLYAAIQVTSSLNALHFINAFHMMDSGAILGYYQNVNLFGYPVSMTAVLPVVFGLVSAGCILLIFLRFYTSAVCRPPRAIPLLSRLFDRVRRAADRWNHHTLPFLHELRKTLISGRALLLLLLLAVFLSYQYQTSYRLVNAATKEYNQYIEQIGGRITDETQEFIAKEWEFLSGVDTSFYSGKMEALPLIENQVNNALKKEAELGIPAYLIDESGFRKLTADQAADVFDSLLILVASVLCCAGIFSRENTFGTKRLLRICPAGSRLAVHKLVISLLLNITITAMVHATRFAIVAKDYALNDMDAPIQSVTVFSGYNHRLTLLQYLILLYAIRLLGGILMGFILSAISSSCRSDASAIAASLAILAGPVIAIGAGVTILKYLSIFSFSGGNLFLQDTLPNQIWFGVAAALSAVCSGYFIRRCWRDGMPERPGRAA